MSKLGKACFHLFLVALALSVACRRNDEPEKEPDVYVAGATYPDRSNKSMTHAMYWKNGNGMPLTDNRYWSRANSVFVSGKDVYIAGDKYDGTKNVALYWKNGEQIVLDPGGPGSVATSVFLSGNDVYTAVNRAGMMVEDAFYWKNQTMVKLADSAHVNSIVVNGNDVYAVGFKYVDPSEDGYSANRVAFWKNGEQIRLLTAQGNGSTAHNATSLAVSGNDIYIIGYEYDSPVYWKNGREVPLADRGRINSVFASGTDVYVAGFRFSQLQGGGRLTAYWKNGTEVTLSDEYKYNWASSLYVLNGKMYVAGGEDIASKDFAKYWKDGQEFMLLDGNNQTMCTSIFVVN